MEIGLFLNTLKEYSQHVYQIDENTVKLLSDTIACADKLIAGAEFVASRASNAMVHDNEFDRNMLCDMTNDGYFRCERFITCCICHVSMKYA